MSLQSVAAAMQRAQTVFERRPDMGLHDDAAATAAWLGGTSMVTRHANGTAIPSDMPAELGGTGEQITPGWLFRAGIASCAATTIAMTAAAEGITLALLEVRAASRTDARALLGMPETDGSAIYPGPRDMHLQVRLAAHGVNAQDLRAMVQRAMARSPITNALPNVTPLGLHIDVTEAM